MSDASPAKAATRPQDVSAAIEKIKEWVKLLDCLIVVGAVDPEVSGVYTVDGETFRDVVPLGDGVHIVISVGDLPTELVAGIHEVEV